MSLRWRIASGLAVIAALVSALGTTGAWVTTSRQLEQSIDQSLLGRAETVQRPDGDERPDRDDDTDNTPGGCPRAGTVQPAAAAQLIASDGTVTVCIPGAVILPVDAEDRATRPGDEPRLRTVAIDGAPYRVLTVPWRDGGALQTARSLDENDEVLAALALRLTLLSAVAIGAAALLGWLFARRLVRPVERLRDSAERIARTQDLSAPVPQGGGGEIGSLAGSFSTMVDALAASRVQQQQLITDASHELRTPLTSLRTNAELLERGELLDAEQRRSAALGIRLEVDELTNLVSELVELATDRSSDEEETQPVRLLDLATVVAVRAHRRTGRVVDVIDDSSAAVLVRPQMAERAIANLVDNAIKYSAGPVEVALDGHRLEVRDRGPGIPAEDLGFVFDRFYRSVAARAEPGSGLGLAIVQQIVERHSGTVWAANRDGGGAVVGFELPGAPGSSA
ncbi:MAG: HAMP domain-containing sensor histidine kinase [Acidimicrobiia bacterium]